jgi:P-type Ca2+ transporter type 2C
MSNWYEMETMDVVIQLGSDPVRGLSQPEAERRLAANGPNELQAVQPVSPWALLLEQFKNVLVLILLIAIGLSALLGHGIEAAAIAVIVLFAVLLGFAQEFRAERAIEALRLMAAPSATVVRSAEEIELPACELVTGDIILLRAGDKVPADARLLEAVNLQAEESALTGESMPVEKHNGALSPVDAPLGDRRNMVYGGTAVSYGRGRAVVVATGMSTEFGKIARLLQSVPDSQTPLQQNLDHLGGALARAAFVVVVLIVGLGVLRGQPFVELLIFGIALAVAVVPEALPAVVTISLAMGVQRMVKRHALIRRLSAVETLGSTSVITSDKTGTLTRDEMTVRKIFVAGSMWEVSGAGYEPHGEFALAGRVQYPSEPLLTLLRAGAFASDADLVRSEHLAQWRIKGDPTEGALVVAAAKAGLHKPDLDAQSPRVGEIPFSSEAKRMTTLHSMPCGVVAYAKGAPEIILASCTRQEGAGGPEPLSMACKEGLLAYARQMASEALRVLAIAYKPNATTMNAELEMTLLGLVGMIDPPRPEAKAAIKVCEQAGIKVVMITGDHPLTAQAIACELGLLRTGRVLTGLELDALSDDELASKVEQVEVCARVSPAHKLRLVRALQQNGHCVAMTGDGVNDAPALKQADIGIAMGLTGTDVTKEAAAMTLTDDNFASIVAAIEEGRAVFGNIKKFLMFLLSSNTGEIGLMAGASLLGLPLPLSAVQILYVNLATDGLPALALAFDPPEDDLMRRPPRGSRASILTRPIVSLILIGGAWSALINLGIFVWAQSTGQGLSEAMSLTLVTLVLTEFFKAYNFRSDRYSLLRRPFANKWLNLAIAWELVLLVMIIYVPFLRAAFGTFALPLADWLIAGALAFSVSPVLELAKWMERRGWFGALKYRSNGR